MTRVIVTGGRDYRDREAVYAVLDEMRRVYGTLCIVHGAARGADQLAHEWAVSRGQEVERHTAQWDLHGKAAGPIRNAEMVACGADLAVAFPGGTGTADCVRRCEEAGSPVRRMGRRA